MPAPESEERRSPTDVLRPEGLQWRRSLELVTHGTGEYLPKVDGRW